MLTFSKRLYPAICFHVILKKNEDNHAFFGRRMWMMQNEKKKTSDLKKIPGVGADMEQDLQNIGIHCIADLKGKDPERCEIHDSICSERRY